MSQRGQKNSRRREEDPAAPRKQKSAPLSPTLDELIEIMWRDYRAINPQADRIAALLAARGERIVNDHVALRTFDLPPVGLEALARPFLERGYRYGGEYAFKAKKLCARHLEHTDPLRPKIFISELKVDECSAGLQKIVRRWVSAVPPSLPSRADFCVTGRPWPPPSRAEYEKLVVESEYAAWMAVFGFRVNHFTVSVNRLTSFSSLQELNRFLIGRGLKLNESGGLVKGSPAELLEQSSTLAAAVEVEFADGWGHVPGCYYEFARRYPRPDGRFFQGFIADSADKIFESTDARGPR